ncbi:MAG: hypothetical protein ACLRFO_00630 [Alphaproteobacteria bacterium]
MTVESPHNGVFVLGLPDVCAVDVYYDLWTNVGNVGRAADNNLGKYVPYRIITFDDRGRMIIDFNRVAPWARDTLENIIRIQLGQDSVQAKNWIDRYAKWTPELASLATKLCLVDRRLNSYVVQPLADMLLQRQK